MNARIESQENKSVQFVQTDDSTLVVVARGQVERLENGYIRVTTPESVVDDTPKSPFASMV